MVIRRKISPIYKPVFDSAKATLGARLRHLRKRLGYEQITSLATVAKLGHNTIAKLERDEMKVVQPWILGRILSVMQGRLKEAFPEVRGDVYDYLIPPTTFGDWLRNFRLRRGLRQGELARTLGVNKFTITRYEANQSMPNRDIQHRLHERYSLNGEFDRFFKPGALI